MARSIGRRFTYAAAALFVVFALLAPSLASATMECYPVSRYYHTHVTNPHIYSTHYVYSTIPSGSGEQTYWKKDYYNFGLIYQGVYYGSKYCA